MKHLQFSCSNSVYQRYLELIGFLSQTQDFSDDFYALLDEIQSLPGFPRGVDVNTRVSVYVNEVQI